MLYSFLYENSTVLLIVVTVAFFAIWLEQKVPFFKRFGAFALVLLLGMLLSNIGILPPDSPVYDFFSGDGVLAGIVLILLKINLETLKNAGGAMIKVFLLGSLGSAMGALVMGLLLIPLIGPEAWKLSGSFAATYIGGGANYAAIGGDLNTDSDLFSAGIAADVLITAIWLIVCILLPSFGEEKRGEPVKKGINEVMMGKENQTSPSLDKLLFKSAKPISLGDLALMFTAVVFIMVISDFLASLLPAVPKIIWLSTLALAAAQVPKIKVLPGCSVIGNYLILLFLVCNGARSLMSRIIEIGPGVLYFALGTVAIHGLFIFGIGRLLRFKGSIMAVASQANIGGSSSALAIATARGYTALVLPGVAAGILGTALGNYVGLAVAFMVKAIAL